MPALSRRRFLNGGLHMLSACSIGTAWAPLTAVASPSASVVATALTPVFKGGLTLLQGAGCNVVALPGPDGALLIDGGLAAHSKALLEAVGAATKTRRVSTLINTHWHPEQTGSNDAVGKAGGLIISHEVTRLYEGRKATSTCYEGSYGPLPREARAVRTTREAGSLDFAGQHIEYGYLPAAHTDGDLYVHFPEHDVLVAGGPVAGGRWPLLDTHNGGWLGGLVRAYEKLASLVDADTRIVPCDGRLLTGADVTRYRDMYQKLFKQMFVYFNHGFGPSDAAADRPLKDHEDELGDASAFVAGAYRSILQAYVPD